MRKLSIEDLSFSYERVHVLKNITFEANKGQMICLLGPNGVGKSTLFGCLLGILNKYDGYIKIDGKDIKNLSRREMAKHIAYVPQIYESNFNYSVLETVLMGLNNQIGAFATPGAKHYRKAMDALERMSIAHLADIGHHQISGGERQLALIARALVQDADILVMDEPTANLDFGNQNHVLKEVKKLCSEGYLILFSSHQPDHAFLYADTAIVLYEQVIRASGNPSKILNEELMLEIYRIPVHIAQNTFDGTMFYSCVPKMQVEI